MIKRNDNSDDSDNFENDDDIEFDIDDLQFTQEERDEYARRIVNRYDNGVH